MGNRVNLGPHLGGHHRRVEPRSGNSSCSGLLLAASFCCAVGVPRADRKGHAPDIYRREPATHCPRRVPWAFRGSPDRSASRRQPRDGGLRLSRAQLFPIGIGHRLAAADADLVWVRRADDPGGGQLHRSLPGDLQRALGHQERAADLCERASHPRRLPLAYRPRRAAPGGAPQHRHGSPARAGVWLARPDRRGNVSGCQRLRLHDL